MEERADAQLKLAHSVLTGEGLVKKKILKQILAPLQQSTVMSQGKGVRPNRRKTNVSKAALAGNLLRTAARCHVYGLQKYIGAIDVALQNFGVR